MDCKPGIFICELRLTTSFFDVFFGFFLCGEGDNSSSSLSRVELSDWETSEMVSSAKAASEFSESSSAGSMNCLCLLKLADE